VTRIALAVTAALLVIAACDADDGGSRAVEAEAATGSFAGTVDGTDAYVAVVVGSDGGVLAYVTDGGSSVDWLDGSLEGPDDTDARLGNDGGAVLDVTFGDARASGVFARPGEELQRFTADLADEPAGLYRATESFDDGNYVAGWIVLPDGTQRGAVRRYETPLPPGSIDATTFAVDTKAFAVPGGVLTPHRVTPANLSSDARGLTLGEDEPVGRGVDPDGVAVLVLAL